jgi:phenylacetate-coenzyme A ligase PaaK-like adenylate-forming protein
MVVAVGSTYASRTTELVKLKGTLINPEILRDEIANTDGVTEYQVVFTKKDLEDPYSPDELIIKVGRTGARSEEDIAAELQQRIQRAVEMRARIEFVELSEIFDPTVALKAMRILDLRPTE